MRIFRSLTNRIFFATALIAILSIGSATFVVNGAVTREAEDELARGLEYAASLVERNRDLLVEQLARDARLIADLPKLKAAVGVNHPPTLRPIAEDYQRQIGADLFVVTNAAGEVLAHTVDDYAPGDRLAELPPFQRALNGRATISFWPRPGGGVQVVTIPIWIDETQPELLGTLSVGFNVDEALAARLKELTDSEVAFLVDGSVRATTLPDADRARLAKAAQGIGGGRVRLGGEEYVSLTRTLSMGGEWSTALDASMTSANAPVVLVLRSRTGRLAFLRSLQAALVGTGLLAVLVATMLSYAVARTVTRPVGAIIETMREMTATGDLTQKISLPDQGRRTDDDARMLARTFNAMTDSIARFQREAAQRERLSSLGRLSTVIAHEIRNPLMIIKTALRTLKREEGAAALSSAAVQDIDEEVERLNRIVGDVLDFARPITFEYAPVSLNQLCADAVQAVTVEPGAPAIGTHLDPAADRVETDGERLRLALVNMLTNARQAVRRDARDRGARPVADDDGPSIELRTLGLGDATVAIVVADRGVGIPSDDVPNVFDPYFTTRRTGSGLGLAIAKNVIEGLGGTIAVSSASGAGTSMRIELPRGPLHHGAG